MATSPPTNVKPTATAGGSGWVLEAKGNDPGSLEYRVTLPQDHELAPGGMAEADLKYLAEQTGGKFYREEDLQTMPQSLPKRTVPVNQRDEILLWNVWSLLAIIGLLSLEWLLRKMNSLS